ncbi:MAG: serine/threonine-protein kinase [Polyangia bacterium]|jgi:serine/threonine-protein kinase
MVKAAPGQTLDGRFQLGEELARGGMSILFKAQDLARANRAVVVKVPLPEFGSGVGRWSLFQREEQIGSQLDHPYVLKFVCGDANQRRPYVVMEHVPGPSLAEHLQKRGPLPEAEALRIASKICEALAHMHERGVVHYDIKPGNVMLCPDGSIRLIDFGMAHETMTSRFTLAGALPAIASSGYVAPEQIKRKRGRTSVDIYGMGATLYEMLTGRTPFPDDDDFGAGSARLAGDPPAPRSLDPRISRAAEEIVLRALRRTPAERYPTAAALQADLDAPHRVVVTGLSDRLQPPTRWRRGLRQARYIAILCLLPVVLQVGLFAWLWHHFAHK